MKKIYSTRDINIADSVVKIWREHKYPCFKKKAKYYYIVGIDNARKVFHVCATNGLDEEKTPINEIYIEEYMEMDDEYRENIEIEEIEMDFDYLRIGIINGDFRLRNYDKSFNDFQSELRNIYIVDRDSRSCFLSKEDTIAHMIQNDRGFTYFSIGGNECLVNEERTEYVFTLNGNYINRWCLLYTTNEEGITYCKFVALDNTELNILADKGYRNANLDLKKILRKEIKKTING